MDINDWYLNAESQGSDRPGYDWENDDPPDRTPDSWLDRLGQRDEMPPQRIRRDGRSTRSPRVSAKPATHIAAQPRGNLAEAARAVLAAEPGLSYRAVAGRLRQRGWPAVTRADVGKVLARSASDPQQSAPRVASKRQSSANLPLRDIATAARAILTAKPGLSYQAVAERLQRNGWPTITRAHVSRALKTTSRLRLSEPENQRTGRQRTRAEARFLGRLARANPMPRAEICPSCGTAVSISGLCRCS
jgi:hypothetical protein